jgi:hypothetical protein
MRVRRKLNALFAVKRKKNGFGYKFLTLTIPTEPDLAASVKTLIASFRRLRQTAAWKSHVIGGAAVIEIKPSGSFWHAHIHTIIFARYWDLHDISSVWRAVSPGYIINIKQVRNNRLAGYLTKYLTKDEATPELQMIMSAALKGNRLFFTFGLFYHDERLQPRFKPICQNCGANTWGIMEFDFLNTLDHISTLAKASHAKTPLTHPPPQAPLRFDVAA